MNTFITIFHKTKETFDYLDEQFEDTLNTNCNLIFMIVGAISGVNIVFSDARTIEILGRGTGVFLASTIAILLSAGISLIICRYFITYLIYGVGRILKGQSEVIDIRVVTAYSLIPIFLEFPIVVYLGITHKHEQLTGIKYWIIYGFYSIVWVLRLKIMIQGLIRFNKYGLMKALINVGIIFILGLSLYMLT